MILTEVWAGLTTVFIVVGFFMGRRDGLRVYNSQFPSTWQTPPPTVDELARVRSVATPYRDIWLRMWGYWILGGQGIYWLVRAVHAAVDSDPAAVVSGVLSYLVWAVPVGAALVATGLVLWKFTRRRPTDGEQQVLVPVLDPPPVVHPAQQETQVMWSAPTYEGTWDRP